MLELWLIQGQGVKGLALFICHILPSYFVDTTILGEIKGYWLICYVTTDPFTTVWGILSLWGMTQYMYHKNSEGKDTPCHMHFSNVMKMTITQFSPVSQWNILQQMCRTIYNISNVYSLSKFGWFISGENIHFALHGCFGPNFQFGLLCFPIRTEGNQNSYSVWAILKHFTPKWLRLKNQISEIVGWFIIWPDNSDALTFTSVTRVKSLR